MDPFYEQKLRDEVIYLHSLWHQASPSTSLPNTNLQPFNSTHFKKPRKKPPKFNARKYKKVGNFSGKEWPVKPLPTGPPVTQSGWPELKLNPTKQTTRLPTPQELEKYNWNRVQLKALNAAKEFYSRNGEDSDEDEDHDYDDDDDMDDDDDDDEEDAVEDKEYEFFCKLFNDDEEFRAYYVNHCGGGGEFSCLVCGVANEKTQKSFKDCIALVQHSISIAKTKKKRSHRAYGKAICKVLEWDIDMLPSSIVKDHKSSELQGNDANADKDANISASDQGLHKIVDNVNPNGETPKDSEIVGVESMVCEDVLIEANVEEETNGKQVLNEAEGNATGTVSNLCRNLSSTMVLEEPVQLQNNL